VVDVDVMNAEIEAGGFVDDEPGGEKGWQEADQDPERDLAAMRLAMSSR
jgi:hypothetical protein